jgi:D-glycero-D-manno-heptose 1,7-bisphosphate phosphatase
MNKVVFLDRDGVINKEIGSYVYELRNFEINPGLKEALTTFKNCGYKFVVVTNQGGISKKIYSKAHVDKINNYLKSWFNLNNLDLLDIMYCPHHDNIEACICRKPNSLLLEKAIAKHHINPEKSFIIGDNQRDIEAAKRIHIKGYLIPANKNLNHFKFI